MFLSLLIFNMFNLNFPVMQIAFSPDLDEVINNIYVKSNSIDSKYSIFFILTSIFSSSTLFFHLLKVGEILYDKRREKFKLMVRLMAIILVFLFILLIISCVIVFIIISYINNYISFKFIYLIFQISITVFVPLIIIVFFNLFIPPVNLGFVNTLPGSFFTLLFWVISTIIFSLYVKFFANFKEIYGTITFFIVFMIWIYILINGLIIGMIINRRNWLNILKLKENL